MIEFTTDEKNPQALVFQDVPLMEGLDFCLMYFDDNTVMYMSPSIRKRVDEGEVFDATYYVLSYRKEDKPIDEVVTEIKEEIEKLPGKKLVIESRKILPTNAAVNTVMVSPVLLR